MAEKKDYYELLGVSRQASNDDLKKAYRQLVKRYHPDVSQDPDAEERFKEISEAYAVLSDPEKRQQYDQYGHAAFTGAGGAAGFDMNFDFNDILRQFFGGGSGFGGFASSGPFQASRRATVTPTQGAHIRYRMTLDFLEAAFGTERDIVVKKEDLCPVCEGSGAEPNTEVKTCPHCQGTGVVQERQQTLFGTVMSQRVCPHCQGSGKQIEHPCHHCHGRGRTQTEQQVHVKVPAGINQGEMLTMRGAGEPGEHGGPYGDLYIQIQIKPHAIFQREGYNVYCELPVTFAQAALGATVDIPTIDGPEPYQIPAGSQAGDEIRLRSKGIPVLGRDRQRGDQIVTLQLEVPRNLSEEQQQLLRNFDDTLHAGNYQKRERFFDKLKNLFRS